MEKMDVTSSTGIISAEYENETLFVIFKTGYKYTYENVPDNVWKDFKKAESKGTYFNKVIKNKFKTTKTLVS